ncbi:hypothetical protein B0H19DRAFT_1226553 [Mycena capillaripes]|nr:hypothetical protein B0H19DRAFT_1226553 [Mycena capillaripes]
MGDWGVNNQDASFASMSAICWCLLSHANADCRRTEKLRTPTIMGFALPSMCMFSRYPKTQKMIIEEEQLKAGGPKAEAVGAAGQKLWVKSLAFPSQAVRKFSKSYQDLWTRKPMDIVYSCLQLLSGFLARGDDSKVA